MGFWNAAVLVNEARRLGMPVFPADVHLSRAECWPEAGGIRLGLSYVKGMGEDHLNRVLEQREQAPFASLEDFCRRTRLGRRLVERLIMAGAMDGWGIARRELVWELGMLTYQEDALNLVWEPEAVELPSLSAAEAMLAEQAVMGLSPGDHVMTFYRARLRAKGVLGSRELAACASGRQVRVAGLLVVHQSPPTAKGFHFLTLEDEDGMMNVIVRPKVYERFRRMIRGHLLLMVGGEVQREGNTSNLLAEWTGGL